MKVGDVCTRDVCTTEPDETLRHAARKMVRNSVGTLIVLDPRRSDPHPVGIVTDRDIVVRGVAGGLDLDETAVAMAMSAPIQAVRADTPLADALSLMSRRAVRRLAVEDEGGHLVGILSLDDVIEALIEEADAIGRLLARTNPSN